MPPGRRRPAPRAGRPAGEDLGACVPGRAAGDGRRVGPAGRVDRGYAVRWAAHRAAASQTGSDGAAWLDGRSARAVSVRRHGHPGGHRRGRPRRPGRPGHLCLQLAGHGPHRVGHGPHCGPPPADPPVQPPAADQPADPPADRLDPAARGRPRIRRGRCSSTRSSAGPSTWSRPGRAGLASCVPGSSAPGWPGRQPAAGRRPQRRDPRRHPPRGDPAGPALPLGRRLRPARVSLRGPSCDPPGRRRQDQRGRLCAVLFFPPSRGHPRMGLDRYPQSGWHHHRPQPRRHQNPAQPQPPRARRITPTTPKHPGGTSHGPARARRYPQVPPGAAEARPRTRRRRN